MSEDQVAKLASLYNIYKDGIEAIEVQSEEAALSQREQLIQDIQLKMDDEKLKVVAAMVQYVKM